MIVKNTEQAALLLETLKYDLGTTVRNWLAADGCEDIVLNSDGRLWVKMAGQDWRQDGNMEPSSAQALITTVARLRGLDVNHEHPKLETVLPTDGSRFEAFVPPIVVEPCFSIRRRASLIYTLDHYVRDGIMTEEQKWSVETAIWDQQTILISGATGSGKTTFLNACLTAFPPHHRVVVVEDTPEVQCCSPNHQLLLASSSMSMEECLKGALRMRPDRIVVGEIRGPEALPMLKAFNTGHPGGLATIHANDPMGALLQVNLRVREALPQYDATDIARTAIQVIVQIKGPGRERGRHVSEVVVL